MAGIEPTVLSWSRTGGEFAAAPGVEFAAALNSLAGNAGRADIALCRDDLALEPGWLDVLAAAANRDDIHAGAGPLWLGSESPPADRLSPVHPRRGAVGPELCYLRRPALDLVGPFEPARSPADVLAGWCQRAVAAGFSFVVADELSIPARATDLEDPLLEELGPLRRTLAAARRRDVKPSVTIDARALGPRSGGTQSYTAALVLAVAGAGVFSLRAVVAHDAPAETTSAFRAAGVEVITYEQVLAGVPHTDLLHRPQQVFGAGDLNLGRLLSDRLVLTHLDLIAFHNPAYHASQDAWLGHRRMTRIGMAAADAVVFTSAHARADALAEELIDPTRATIAPIGVEPAATATPRQPAGLGGPDPFLLVLGADYAHKNRPFALRLFKALREQHGFPGRLVLAGAHVEHGSTADQERAILEADPELAASVVELGPVPEEEKHWLLGHATALLCPSTYEGYGLTPLEAAAADLPCVFAAVTAHADVLDPQAATITTWDAEASAAAAAGLLRQGEARDRHLALMRSALDRANWPAAAAQLARAYELALSGSYRAAAASAWEQLERELVIADLNEHRLRLEAIVGHGLTLAGHGGLLTPEQQLGLIRVARRPWLARTLLAPFTRIGSLGRHR